jgi:hypothetical protein
MRSPQEWAAGQPATTVHGRMNMFDAGAQRYEYIHCHPATGLMANG